MRYRGRRTRRAAIALLTFCASWSTTAVALSVSSARAGAATGATPLIVDTDLYSNTDDEGALAVAFALQLQGSANLLAIGVNTRTSRPAVATNSWKCAAAITQFYGFPDVPIGSDMPDNGTTVNSPDIVGPCAALASPSTPSPAPVVPLYRKVLASQPDGSVVMVCIGYEENLANLLASGPDSSSPLSGVALVAEKVKELVIMGGGYPSRPGENNFIGNPAAAASVAAGWPTKVVYSGYEVGYGVFTGHTLTSVHPASSPVRVAYQALVGPNANNRSYDLTAVYHALVPSDPALTEVGPGQNAIDATGANVFTPGAGDEYYLSLGSATTLQNTLESLLDVLPGTTPQAIAFTSSPPPAPDLGSTYAPAATGGGSGNPVTFSIDPSSTSGCTYDWSTGLVTFAAPTGSCVIDADEGGTTAYAAAPRVSQSLNVQTAPQAITYSTTPPPVPTVGGTYAVAATASSGLPVTIVIDASSTSGCAYSAGSGLVSFSSPAGTCVIDAEQPGNASWSPAPTTQQLLTVAKGAQSLTFTTTPPSQPGVGQTFPVAASSTAGLAVSLVVDPVSGADCSLGTGSVTILKAGPCAIDASQAGNGGYLAASTVQQVEKKGTQTLRFTTSPPSSARVLGTYAVAASSSAGLPVTITVDARSSAGCTYAQATGLVTFTGPAGTCVLDANQPGTPYYLAASQVQQQIKVAKATQVITFTTLPPSPARVQGSYAVAASASSGLAVVLTIDHKSSSVCTLSGGVVTLTGPGTCTIDANQPGTSSWAAAPQVRQTFVVTS